MKNANTDTLTQNKGHFTKVKDARRQEHTLKEKVIENQATNREGINQIEEGISKIKIFRTSNGEKHT